MSAFHEIHFDKLSQVATKMSINTDWKQTESDGRCLLHVTNIKLELCILVSDSGSVSKFGSSNR